ncbi:hypothetical protein ACOMHN_041061 [Nucella lapillus]
MKKSKKVGKGGTAGRGVVYLGHLPAGFYEPQMKHFFSQFGRITRLRISRSKKTGKSKGYAFVEFHHSDVAKVVADTMNNYLMFMRLLKCQLVDPEKVHPDTFKGCTKKFSAPRSAEVAAKRHNNKKTEAQEKRARGRQTRNLKKMVELGILEEDEKYRQLSAPVCDEQVAQSPVPATVNTPAGKLQVLKEDPSDAEVTFRTPPGVIKSSRLAPTPKKTSSAKNKKRVSKRLK